MINKTGSYLCPETKMSNPNIQIIITNLTFGLLYFWWQFLAERLAILFNLSGKNKNKNTTSVPRRVPFPFTSHTTGRNSPGEDLFTAPPCKGKKKPSFIVQCCPCSYWKPCKKKKKRQCRPCIAPGLWEHCTVVCIPHLCVYLWIVCWFSIGQFSPGLEWNFTCLHPNISNNGFGRGHQIIPMSFLSSLREWSDAPLEEFT